ncbi:TIGR01777 family oxidoreductase [Bacillus suaedae]|uniref:TIGR01777 family oxidoreductase n=1 Tax=Halalkalibacter suaedae TaxID=2822140 RepID=A0A940WXY4_9BACI|nr:TIGR01777 family oxidoreductase [Bacillus suaedae]MBP3952668.1 TIGR01777 family oxidoreductase [Bacillus suaedae]
MKKKVVLAGGTGFIGTYFAEEFRKLDYEVKMISRQSVHTQWEDKAAIIDLLNGADLLINLAGKSVNCRYHEKNKEEIMHSRTETTEKLGEAILECSNPPKLWINSSTATIYRHAEDRPMTEDQGEIGAGFSVDVAKAWERSFFQYKLPETRQVALRIAIVLGEHGGVMTPFKNLVRFGLGGHQGTGEQMFSWIHVEDLFEITRFLERNEQLSGVFNCSAPNPVKNRELMKQLRRVMNRNVGLPAAKWMLEIGAWLIRTETELIVKSRWVIPERLEREGYTFKYDTLEKALRQMV